MELTMMSMKKYDFFALLSLDNGRINYEQHSFNDSQISLITNPDLMKLLLNNSKFDQESIQSSVIKLLNDHNPNEFALMELFDKLQSMDNLVFNGIPGNGCARSSIRSIWIFFLIFKKSIITFLYFASLSNILDLKIKNFIYCVTLVL